MAVRGMPRLGPSLVLAVLLECTRRGYAHAAHAFTADFVEVWTFDSSTERFHKLCDGGPAPAGHVAAADCEAQRLVVCFGVRRSQPSA